MVTGPVVIARYRDSIDLVIAGFHPKSDLFVKNDRIFVYRRSARPDNRAVLAATEFKNLINVQSGQNLPEPHHRLIMHVI